MKINYIKTLEYDIYHMQLYYMPIYKQNKSFLRKVGSYIVVNLE